MMTAHPHGFGFLAAPAAGDTAGVVMSATRAIEVRQLIAEDLPG